MFAGPNGSGKSTLKDLLRPEWLGHYLNPDDLERELRAQPTLAFARFGVAPPTTAALHSFFQNHALTRQKQLPPRLTTVRVTADGLLDVAGTEITSYFTAILADWLRRAYLATQQSFAFETVMSSADKVAFLQEAQAAGFRNYLYFVATESAEINVGRVKLRVQQGGHDVPSDTIRARYRRSLDLLAPALRWCHRAYLFDNSTEGTSPAWVAELTPDGELIPAPSATDEPPLWLQSVFGQLLPPA